MWMLGWVCLFSRQRSTTLPAQPHYLLATGQKGVGGLTLSSELGLVVLQAAFVGAMAIADMVKTTLGPKGMVRALGQWL